jgi:hypothetical protein
MPGAWRDNHNADASTGALATVTRSTQTNVPLPGDYFFAWNVGWQGTQTETEANGARMATCNVPAVGNLVEIIYEREPGANHVIQCWLGGPLLEEDAGGHHEGTWTPIAPSVSGTFRYGICSIGNLAENPVDVAIGQDDHAPGDPVTSPASGAIVQDDELALALMYPVDGVGQTITDDPGWLGCYNSDAAEPISFLRKNITAAITGAGRAQWTFSGSGPGFNPLLALITLKVLAEGGGGEGTYQTPGMTGGLSPLTGGLQA